MVHIFALREETERPNGIANFQNNKLCEKENTYGRSGSVWIAQQERDNRNENAEYNDREKNFPTFELPHRSDCEDHPHITLPEMMNTINMCE